MFAPRSEERPRKRQRKARSCEQCRNRKVKCDQELPCGPCRRSRDAIPCNYRDHDFLAANKPEVNNSSNADPVPTSSDTHANPGHPHACVLRLSAYDETVRKLQERVRRLENSQARETDHLTITTGLSVDPITPRLRSTAEKVKLFGQSHWMHAAEKIHAIGPFDAEVEPPLGRYKAELVRAFNELRSLRSAVKSHQQPDLDNLISTSDLPGTFPPRKECDILIDGYLRTFEKIYRILHVPTFLEQYAQFWDNAEAVPKVFNIKLALILAIGVAFTPPKDISSRDFDSLRRQAKLWVYAAQLWFSGLTEKTTHNLHALQAFCMLFLARQVNDMGISPSLSPASLLSMAMQMGLHRDSQIFPSLSHFEVESRARLWATVVELYVPSLLDNSMPMLVDIEAVDAKEPSNINDSDMIHDPIHEAPQPPGDRTTDTSIQLLLLKSQKLRLRAVQVLSDTRMRTSYETVVELANQLRTACTEVAAFFQSRASHLEPETVAFHRKYIDLYLRRHILLLHRPFVLQAQEDPRFYLSRKVCLDSCMIMASYTDDLNLPMAEPDDFSSLMIHGSGHFRGGLSLDVIVTLALELITQLQEDGPGRAPGRQQGEKENEQPSYDPARELARAAQEPIIRRLQHIQEQLFQVVAFGKPSLKRSGIISALLAQVRALEAGGNFKEAFCKAIGDCMEKLSELLRLYLVAHTPQAQGPADEVPAVSDEFEIDFAQLDLDALMDPLSLMSFPTSDGKFGGFGF